MKGSSGRGLVPLEDAGTRFLFPKGILISFPISKARSVPGAGPAPNGHPETVLIASMKCPSWTPKQKGQGVNQVRVGFTTHWFVKDKKELSIKSTWETPLPAFPSKLHQLLFASWIPDLKSSEELQTPPSLGLLLV